MRWKKWDVPAGIATVTAAIITVAGGLLVYSLSERPTSTVESGEPDTQIRVVLEHTLTTLKARRVVLFKQTRPIREGYAQDDMKGNGLQVVTSVDTLRAQQLPVADIPFPMDMVDFPGANTMYETIFDEFVELPDRTLLPENSLFGLYMKNNGLMAILVHHLKNSNGDVVGALSIQYSDPQAFTDFQKDIMRHDAKRLRFLLSWLDGEEE